MIDVNQIMRMRTSWRGVVVVLAAVGSLVIGVGMAQAKLSRRAATNTYAPRFHQINGSTLAGNSGLVVVSTASGELLYGSKPYSPTLVTPPNCSDGPQELSTLVGTGALLFGCSSFETYNAALRTWTTADQTPTVDRCQRLTSPMGQCQVLAVGTRWIEYGAQSYHVAPTYFLVSTATGAIRPLPSRSGLDLNARHPARKHCVTVAATAPATVTFVGDRALVFRPSGRTLGVGRYVIARCRSTKQIKLPSSAPAGLLGSTSALIAINHKLIVWYPGSRNCLDGLNTTTGRRFTIRFPAPISFVPVISVALTAKSVYVQTGTQTEPILTAPLPTALR